MTTSRRTRHTTAAATPRYRRIVLKLSGEALQGRQGYGIDPAVLRSLADQLKELQALGVQVAVVIGGGNIFRGVSGTVAGVDRATGDYMGMLATVINGLALQAALESVSVATRVQTAIQMHELAESYIRRRAIRHLEKGRTVIFVGGTGNPYFTTDTTAALRGMEIGADVILKATKVDGVYSADPLQDKRARKFARLGYSEVLQKRLNVMDATAVSLCREHQLPIIVFNVQQPGNIKRVVLGEPIGTVVGGSR